jgi:hypothetical protein
MTAVGQQKPVAADRRSLLIRILTSRGFGVFATLMLGGWAVYTLISVTIGFVSDELWAIGWALTVLILPYSPVVYVIAGIFRPPAPFRAGVLMGVLATLAIIAYFVIDAVYWGYEWSFDPGSWALSYGGDTTGVLTIVAVLAGIAGAIGLLAGTCTAGAAWITNKVRGPRDRPRSGTAAAPRTPGPSASPFAVPLAPPPPPRQ